jgi:hypothetical protein
MIKINLDESYVFDLLSINEVKLESTSDLNKKTMLQHTYESLKLEIIESIGLDTFDQIISSQEYLDLKLSNKHVFDLVDRANETELSKLTADANYQRYLNKMSLQNKFFITKLTEVKI